MDSKINSIIQNFVAELSAALTEASHAAINVALGGGAASAGNGRRIRPNAGAHGIGVGPRGRGGKRTRRTEADVQAQLDKVVSFLKRSKEPTGADAITKALGLTTTELATPIKLGLSSKLLSKQGQRRGTKYSIR